MSEDTTNKRIGWGVKTPSISFSEVVELIQTVGNKFGDSGHIEDVSIVSGNSAKSSTFVKKIRDLKNFNLIQVEGDNFELSELGIRIAHPKSKTDEVLAKFESFKSIENLKRIWDYYRGKRLPQKEFLANAIMSLLGIPKELKEAWAEYFIDASFVAGVLLQTETGLLQVLSNPKTYEASTQLNEDVEEDLLDKKQEKPKTAAGQKNDTNFAETTNSKLNLDNFLGNLNGGMLYQIKISGGRKVFVFIPEGLRKNDVERIKSILKSAEAGLEGLLEEDENIGEAMEN